MRENPHRIPRWRQVLGFLFFAGVQLICGIMLRSQMCALQAINDVNCSGELDDHCVVTWKSGWGIAHIIMGGLTVFQAPCTLRVKCNVGARRRLEQPQHVQQVVRQMAAAGAAGAGAGVGAGLPQTNSIELQQMIQPEADREVVAMMEKTSVVSPEGVRLLGSNSGVATTAIATPRLVQGDEGGDSRASSGRMTRLSLQCQACAGAGIVSIDALVFSMPRPQESESDKHAIVWQKHTVPPTVQRVMSQSPLSGQLKPGDRLIRVVHRVAVKMDKGVRYRRATAPALDTSTMNGSELTRALENAPKEPSLVPASTVDTAVEGEEQVEEQVLAITRPKTRQQSRLTNGFGICFVCEGEGLVDGNMRQYAAPSQMGLTRSASLQKYDPAGPLNNLEAQNQEGDEVEQDEFPCEICYDTSKFGVSTECLHFYCEGCIQGSLQAMLDTGQFPAYCPACRVDSKDQGHSEPTKGRIEGPALTFLQQRGVLTLDFQFRFMRQQDQSSPIFFKCPAAGCSRYLIDQDPQYAIVPRGSTEVEGFERKMRLGKCECGARVCVRCHMQATPERKSAIAKLAEVMKEDEAELWTEYGRDSHGKSMEVVAELLTLERGHPILVYVPDAGPSEPEPEPESVEEEEQRPVPARVGFLCATCV